MRTPLRRPLVVGVRARGSLPVLARSSFSCRIRTVIRFRFVSLNHAVSVGGSSVRPRKGDFVTRSGTFGALETTGLGTTAAGWPGVAAGTPPPGGAIDPPGHWGPRRAVVRRVFRVLGGSW